MNVKCESRELVEKTKIFEINISDIKEYTNSYEYSIYDEERRIHNEREYPHTFKSNHHKHTEKEICESFTKSTEGVEFSYIVSFNPDDNEKILSCNVNTYEGDIVPLFTGNTLSFTNKDVPITGLITLTIKYLEYKKENTL